MPKYYVAGIPFDSEDCLKHYGVKGMKWNQHIFGIDANDKYINWLKDAGQNIGKFANNAANTVSNAATSAARAVGGALNKSANFVTGNQARQNLNNAKANAANVQSGRSKVNDAYARYDQLRNSEAQHRNAANGWRESQANRAPLENFGRNQDRINADNEDRRANQDANRAEIAKMKADRMAERQRNAETQARAEEKNAQQAYDRTLPGAAENASRGAQGFINSAGKWVSTAANDVGNAAKQAGQWIGDTAQKAWESPWVNPEKAVNVAGQWIGDRANDLGKAATNAYNDVSKAVSGNGVEADVSERIAKKYGLNSVEDVLAMDRATAEKMLQERDAEISKAKDNSLFGRIGNAANAVGNWVGDRAKDVGNVATDAWNGVTDAANQAGQWIGDQVRGIGGERITEQTIPEQRITEQTIPEQRITEQTIPEQRITEQTIPEQSYGDRVRSSGSVLSNARTASERESALRDIVSAIDAEKGFGGGSDFDKDTPMSHFAGRAKNNFEAIDNLERALKYESDPNSDYAKSLKKELDYYRIDNDLLSGEFYHNQNSAGRWGPGNINYNNKPDNVSQENWDFYCGENYGIGPMANLYGMSIAERREYEKNLKHSELDGRPEGVGEAFWKNYIAHGGTREDYEREWR